MATIGDWLASTPGLNLGIRTDDLFVVDADNLEIWYGILRGRGHDETETFGALVVRTPRGGAHYCFKLPNDPRARCTTNANGHQGIDVRAGDGGYIVAAGSIVNGKQYTVERGELGDLLPDPPRWILDALFPTRTQKECISQPATAHHEHTPEESLALINRCLERLSPEDCDAYDSWLLVGMAIHSATDGAAAGLAAWEKWSSRSPRFTEGACAAKWKTFDASGGVGLGSLIQMAGLSCRAQARPSPQQDANDPVAGPGGIDLLIASVRKTRARTTVQIVITRDGALLGEFTTSLAGSAIEKAAKTIADLSGDAAAWKDIRAWMLQRRLRSDQIAAAQRRGDVKSGGRPEDVIARTFIECYGIQFTTPRGAFWLEKNGNAREEWPSQLLGSMPPQALDALVDEGFAGDREEAHSLAKRLKDLTAYRVRELVPDELGAELDRESLRARHFCEALLRRLLQPSEWWPPTDAGRGNLGKCGPGHIVARDVAHLEHAAHEAGPGCADGQPVNSGHLGKWHRAKIHAPVWFRCDAVATPGGGDDYVARIAISHSLLDPKETVAARDKLALRRLCDRYGILGDAPDLGNRAPSASTATGLRGRQIRVVPLSPAFTATMCVRAAATDPGHRQPLELDDALPSGSEDEGEARS